MPYTPNIAELCEYPGGSGLRVQRGLRIAKSTSKGGAPGYMVLMVVASMHNYSTPLESGGGFLYTIYKYVTPLGSVSKGLMEGWCFRDRLASTHNTN